MLVLNSLVGIRSSCTHEEFIRILFEYFSKELGRVVLIEDSYRNFSLKREEQEGRGTCLKSKVADNVHVHIICNNEKKKFIRVTFTAFQSKCNLVISKDENRYNHSSF